MTPTKIGTRIAIKNILFLSDFSEPSEAALPFAVDVARAFGATVQALHVLTPEPYAYMPPEAIVPLIEALEESAHAGLSRLDSLLTGVPHEVSLVRESSVWRALEQQIIDCHADLIVLGTHGRTGAQKLLLGSVAEEVFRRAPVPVLTIGPGVQGGLHHAGHFRRVLLATDFTPESLAAVPYAVSFAEENQAQLILLHVLPKHEHSVRVQPNNPSVADAIHKLHQLVPKEADSWCNSQAVVEHGDAAGCILQTAFDRDTDLIVLGVRGAAGHLGAATHLGGTTAHKIVAHAGCPVLTVRG